MKYLIILLTLALVSCNDNKKTEAGQDLPFFLFDQVEYYHKDLSKDALQTLQMEPEKSRKDQALLQIVSGNIPVSIQDTLFIKNMGILGFEKQTLDAKYNKELSHLFSSREVANTKPASCTTGYNDVLIFRRDKKIIGMAKISFDCGHHQMIGERYSDHNFGQSGEYEALKKILRP